MRIQVVGAGSWGLALARLAAVNGHDVLLWCRQQDGPDALRSTRHSPLFLKDMALPDNVEVTSDVDGTIGLTILAVPSHAMRSVASQCSFPSDAILVSVAKGIENGTLMRMSEVIEQVAPGRHTVALSGPSHAEEVARDQPASVTVAGRDPAACELVRQALMGPAFRIYTSADIVGVELGGALKNVIAVAAGACDGIGLGDNAKAALITRGLAEIARLGVAMGADPLTFAGLSGMGDLIVTCASRHSRNRDAGERIAKGATVEQVLAGPMVAEGIRTARSAYDLALRQAIEMPIVSKVHAVLYEGANLREAVHELMVREPKPERL